MNENNLKVVKEIIELLTARYTSAYVSQVKIARDNGGKEEYLITLTPW